MEKQKEELEAMIDWVQVTFKEINAFEIMKYILQFSPNLMTYEEKGKFRYRGKWGFGGIEILTPPNDYLEMGFHLYLTGSACRSLEIYLKAQNRTWLDFFEKCLEFRGVFTRLDIAIDDRKPYFAIRDLGMKITKKECISKFKNWTFIDSGTTTGEKTGCTINLGSRESQCFMVFYEKNYEQSQKTGVPLEMIGDWNRYEVRLRKEVATNCIRTLLEKENLCFIGLEIINYYMRIVVTNKADKNRARWETWKPWEEFLEGMNKLKLTMRPAPRTLEQKKHWIANYVAPTLKMIQLADDNLGDDFLNNTLKNTTLKESQKKIVEDYLHSRYEFIKTETSIRKTLQDTSALQKIGFTVDNNSNIPFS
jgi:Putative phage replication protein RstA